MDLDMQTTKSYGDRSQPENHYPTSLVLYSATLLSSRCELHISDVLDYVPLTLILLCRDHEAVHRMTSVLVFKVYVLMNII